MKSKEEYEEFKRLCREAREAGRSNVCMYQTASGAVQTGMRQTNHEGAEEIWGDTSRSVCQYHDNEVQGLKWVKKLRPPDGEDLANNNVEIRRYKVIRVARMTMRAGRPVRKLKITKHRINGNGHMGPAVYKEIRYDGNIARLEDLIAPEE